MYKFLNFVTSSNRINFHLWKKAYSTELQKTLKNPKWYRKIQEYFYLEREMSEYFQQNYNNSESLSNETNLKNNFNYILIDSRKSKCLSKNKLKDEHIVWKQFLLSIFYIGKGKEKRPYSHFNAANKIYQILNNKNGTIINETEKCLEKDLPKHFDKLIKSRKLLRIIDIWSSQNGVICLPIFHNTLPKEAYTREAAIIDALGLESLTNKKRGKYYGITKKWSIKKRKLLGVALLQKAMTELFNQTENKIYPKNVLPCAIKSCNIFD